MNTQKTTIISGNFHNTTDERAPYADNLNTILSILLITIILLSICAFCYQIANSGGEEHYIIKNYSPNNTKINRLINLGIISTIVITDKNKQEYTQDDCCICLNNLVIHDSIHVLPCKHYFHNNCIKPWLFEKLTCPLCKFHLINDIEETNESLETNENQIIRIEVI